MRKRNKGKKNIKIIVLIFAILSISFSFILYKQIFNIYNPLGSFSVQEKDSLEYLVYLKSDEFSNTKVLGMNENYLYSYTDHIEVNNLYTAVNSEDIKTKYNYRAMVTLIARYIKSAGMLNNPIVMEKSYIFDQETDSYTGNCSISKAYDINLDPYKNEFDRFASTVTVPISTEIRVDFIVDLTGENNEFQSTFKRGLTIPLSEEFYNITMEGDEGKTHEYNSPKKTVFTPLIIITSLIILTSFTGLFIGLKLLLRNKSKYLVLINKYLKTYDDIITNTKTKMDFENYKVIEVENFKELLNLVTNTGLQIMFYEESEKAYFYTLYNDIIYLYLISKDNYSSIR